MTGKGKTPRPYKHRVFLLTPKARIAFRAERAEAKRRIHIDALAHTLTERGWHILLASMDELAAAVREDERALAEAGRRPEALQ